MGLTACTEPQCLYEGDLYLTIKIMLGRVVVAISRYCHSFVILCQPWQWNKTSETGGFLQCDCTRYLAYDTAMDYKYLLRFGRKSAFSLVRKAIFI